MKQCSRCKESKPVDEFNKSAKARDGLNHLCRECHRADSLSRYRADKPRHKANMFKFNIEAHGITAERYDEILASQGGACAACGSTELGGRGRFDIDHDHDCCPGRYSCGSCVRGLLCRHCNTTLGYAKDNPDTLISLAAYLMAGKDVLGALKHG